MVMDKLGIRVSENPKLSIFIIVVITLLALGCIQIFGIDSEFSEESFMPENEMVQASDEISAEYTSTAQVSILVKSKNGDLLTKDSLLEIMQIEQQIINDEKVRPNLENPDVPSLNVNSVADIIAQMAFLQYNAPLENLSDNEIKQLIFELLSSNETSPQIKGMFSFMLTKDFNPMDPNRIKAKGTMIIFIMNASKAEGGGGFMGGGQSALTKAEYRMDEIVKDTDLDSTEMTVFSGAIIGDEIMSANNESMAILLPLAFGMVVIILAIIYRSGIDMLFSLLALTFAIIWVYGFGAAMGYTFNPMTTAVPILIVGLGIDYGIHITMRYREELKAGKKIEKSIQLTVKSVGMALLLATITTVVAFLSNIASPISLLGEFGILSAIGIIGSFITMTTFVPACKQLRDMRRLAKGKPLKYAMSNNKNNNKTKRKSAGVKILDKAMSTGAVAAEHHPMVVLIIVLIITVGAGWLGSQVETRFDFEDFLPDDLEISKDIDFMLNEFEVPGGEADQVNILVKGDITDPQLLRDMGETVSNMGDDKSVIKLGGRPDVESILAYMNDWATNSTAINPNDIYDPNFEILYNNVMTPEGLPNTGATSNNIRQLFDYLILNPYSVKDTENLLHQTEENTYDGTVIRVSVKVDMDDNEGIDQLHDDLKNDKKPLDDSADRALITGGPVLTKEIMDTLNESQLRSLVITIIISLIILTIVFWYKWRSKVLGLITITPVVFCVIWTLATMYIVDIPLNVMTITIASLTVGLGITYGIHITHRFLEDLEKHDSIDDACLSTVSHTGTALFGAAATTIAGFGLLVFALMPPIQQFGGITAMTILYSFLSSVFILPTFLVLWARYRRKRGNLHNSHNHKKEKDTANQKVEEVKN
jgi:predicted RND superfamily exporter protein